MHSVTPKLPYRADAPHGWRDALADAALGRQVHTREAVSKGRLHDGGVRKDARQSLAHTRHARLRDRTYGRCADSRMEGPREARPLTGGHSHETTSVAP